MDKIFLDLEFCPVPGGEAGKEIRQVCQEEIIQIGAVRLNEENEEVSTFNELVHPQYSAITDVISSLTHITNEMVADVRSYLEAMGDFLDWIYGDKMLPAGSPEWGEALKEGQVPKTDMVVYSWSMNDWTVMRDEARLKGLLDPRLTYLGSHWRDLQAEVDEVLNLTKALSLDNALKGCDIPFEGQQHSAIDDARNTAVLYQTMQDPKAYRLKMKPIVDLMTPKEDLTTSMGDLFKNIRLDS